MSNGIRNHSNNDLLDDMYSNIAHNNIDQKQTTNHNLYTLADNELQLSSDLKDLDQDSTNNHKGDLIIAYDNKVRNKTLCSRIFYALYVKSNQEGNGYLIYRLDKDLIVVTKNFRTVPVPEDMDHTSINDEDQYTQEAEEVL